MSQEYSRGERQPGVQDGAQLGASFEAHNSESYGGREGRAFEERNAKLAHEVVDKKSHAWIWILLILLIAAAVFFLRRNKDDKSAGAGAAGGKAGGGRGQQGPPAITTAESKTGDMPVYINALGTVTPTNTVTVYSQITGRVLSVHYQEGQLVRKGQPLIDVDPAPYEATLRQAEGTLEHDLAVLAQARIDYDRYKAAYARNAIAKQQVDDQEQAVKQYEGTVKTDQGTVLYDQVQLSYCHIVSPITGRVGLRLVDPGNTVFSGTGSTLAVITQVSPITVVFNVSEDDLPAVQAQLKGKRQLEVDAFDRSNANQLEAGTLNSLNNQIDTTTGTIKFRASFQNADLTLFPNQFVNARLLVNTLKSVTLVPTVAVQHNGTAAFVYVVKAGADGKGPTVAVQPITTQSNDANNTAVTGLDANTTLATSGFDRLENGAEVTTKQAGQKGADSKPSATATGAPSR
ncbi:membrane fusion protein, multidrug efflux system [Granulicella rosea]|uniref:Membrane fusion protein, multidrug efflux system n=1 Tax=Granulicella rosea TaxID=474952 RepID=A0A239KA76_9BACT|nr:efflux RND transporter periplasmic adaptor subunit [Granulicella rosea]SNT14911.1 membrane fusion protein, multidrug efflux system [Granulicella rosea]